MSTGSHGSLRAHGGRQLAVIPPAEFESLQHAYFLSIEDAAATEPLEVLPLPLRPLPRSGTIDVALVTRFPNSFPPGQTINTTFGTLFVASDRELKNKCSAFSTDNINLRLNQLLGLPPENTDRTLVVLRVNVRDLFRPCPDPSITTQFCPVDYPPNTPSEQYQFMAEYVQTAYRIPNGFPFTR